MRIVRVLSGAEAVDNCCFANECDADPSFEVATALRGTVVACEAHVEELLPPEQRPARPRRTPPASAARGIAEVFRAEDALARVQNEIGRRVVGLPPDGRYDPILDSLLDLMDALDG